MPRSNFENLRVYQLSEAVADSIWNVVMGWDRFAKDTVGKQLARAADSIGANIAEGDGRGTYQENKRFIRIARGSLNETKHWLRRAYKRQLLTEQQTQLLSPNRRTRPSANCVSQRNRQAPQPSEPRQKPSQ